MRLGGPVILEEVDPDRWVKAVKTAMYRAAYCPVAADAGAEVIEEYAAAAKHADIVIAEVGAWSNPLSLHAETRRKAIEHCQQQLALADAIGARCCVNIS